MNCINLENLIKNVAAEPVLIGRRNLKSAAVMIPFIESGGKTCILLEKRAAHIPQGSEICFPGGEFDPAFDATLQETAIRETCEELGISRERITVKCKLGTVMALRGIAVDCFIAVLDIVSLDEIKIDRSEVEAAFILPISHFIDHAPQYYSVRVEMHPHMTNEHGKPQVLLPAEKLGLPEKYHKPWVGRDHKVIMYQTDNGPVWGLTAQIIDEVLYQMTKS